MRSQGKGKETESTTLATTGGAYGSDKGPPSTKDTKNNYFSDPYNVSSVFHAVI
jgi:hypothetical protein